MRPYVVAAALVAATTVLPHARPAVPDADRPPNVLVILADDLGLMDVGVYNPDTFYDTPQLDALARRGLRFTTAYAAAPVCSPTRASLLTGRHPARLGTTDWFGAPQPDTVSDHRTRDRLLLPAPYVDRLPASETTVAEAFRAAGYRTFFAGKWHLGPEGSSPEDHGFEVNRGGLARGSPPGRGRYFPPYDNPRLPDGPPGEHLPARLAEKTASFFRAHRDEPVFAYLSFYSVHTPLMTRPDLVAKYDARRELVPPDAWGREGDRAVRLVQNHSVYAGMVEAMDQAVGSVLAAIEALDLAERTLVVFTSDNGGLSTSEGHPTSNLPLRAGKGWLYEGGLRVPAIVAGPGVVTGTTDAPLTSADLYPTLLAAAGLPLRPAQHLDGRSLAAVLRGAAPTPAPTLFWHYPHYGNQGGAPGSALREGRWKLVEHFEDDRVELFDLGDDPGEQRNLAAARPDLARRLRAQLTAWRDEVGARLPTRNPDAALRGSSGTR